MPFPAPKKASPKLTDMVAQAKQEHARNQAVFDAWKAEATLLWYEELDSYIVDGDR